MTPKSLLSVHFFSWTSRAHSGSNELRLCYLNPKNCDHCGEEHRCSRAGTVAHVSRTLVKVRAPRNWGTFSTFPRERLGGAVGSTDLGACVARVGLRTEKVAAAYVPVQRVPEMASYENDLKSERLKLPASSL